MKKGICLFLALAMLGLSACALIPEEETFKSAPIIRNNEVKAYRLASAVRGDLQLTARVTCTYVPIQTENLAFPVGGENIDEIYVSQGDTVESGQLLGQLSVDGIQESIDSCQRQIGERNLQLSQLWQQQSLSEERINLQYADDPEGLTQAMDAMKKSFRARRQELEDAVTVLNAQMAEYRDRLAERQLVAGLSGTVTYARAFADGAKSTLGETVITIADSAMSLFRAETEYWEKFQPGELYTIMVNETAYEAVAADAEELGLPAAAETEDGKASVYFRLTQPALELESNDRGVITLVLDERRDVLLLDRHCISKMGDKQVVYYLDEQGLRRYCEVETGLEAEDLVEILHGMDEGDSAILD